MVTTLSVISPWVQAARPVGHGMIALPLLWGQAVALNSVGAFHWHWFVLIQLYAVFFQIYILYLNDYADEAVDRLNEKYWLSGGSRVIPDGKLTGKQLYKGALLALAGLILIALLSYVMQRPWMLLGVVLAAFAGWSYSVKPLQASYHGWGEWVQGLSCGVLLPVTAFYLQCGSLQGLPWLWLLPLSLLFYAGNIVTALPDTPADTQGGKRSYPMRYGEQRARRDAVLLLALACLFALVGSYGQAAWAVMALLVCTPAMAFLYYLLKTELVQNADVLNWAACKKFVLLASLSQAWLLTGWTLLLFWQGLK